MSVCVLVCLYVCVSVSVCLCVCLGWRFGRAGGTPHGGHWVRGPLSAGTPALHSWPQGRHGSLHLMNKTRANDAGLITETKRLRVTQVVTQGIGGLGRRERWW